MAVGRVINQLEWLCSKCASSRYGQDERGYNAGHSRNLTCQWNALVSTLSEQVDKNAFISQKLL